MGQDPIQDDSEARPPARKLCLYSHEHAFLGARDLIDMQDLKGKNMLLILKW